MKQVNKVKYELLAIEYQSIIDTKEHRIKELATKLSSKNTVEDKYITIAITIFYLQSFTLYFKLNKKYNEFFNKNNFLIINKVRKNFVAIFQLLDTAFGINISTNISKNTIRLKALTKLTPKRLHNLIYKLESACLELKDTYGTTSKYSTNIITMYGNLVGFITNCIDFKTYFMATQDLRHPDNLQIKALLAYILEILEHSANFYIEGFNLKNSQKMLQEGLLILSFLENLMRLQKNDNIHNIIRKKQSWQRLLDT